jgi:hypothetical protein
MLISQEGMLNKRLLNNYYGQGVLLKAQCSILVRTPQAQRKVVVTARTKLKLRDTTKYIKEY